MKKQGRLDCVFEDANNINIAGSEGTEEGEKLGMSLNWIPSNIWVTMRWIESCPWRIKDGGRRQGGRIMIPNGGCTQGYQK